MIIKGCLLPNNGYDYHSCPLCGHALICDDVSKENIYCPKYVDVHAGTRWCHYVVGTCDQGPDKGQRRYAAVIPPFYITWYQETGKLWLQQFGVEKLDWRMHHTLDYQENYPFDDLLKLYKRMENLRAFS
jgi:hypothetical protein